MKKGIFLVLFWLIFFATHLNQTYASSELLAINFTQQNEVSQLELVFNSNNVEAKKFSVTEDKQIIVDLENVRATDRVMRPFDTSEFSGSIVFISAYQKPEEPSDVRVALQLRDNVRSILKKEPNRIILEVENRFGAFSKQKIDENITFEESIVSAENNEDVVQVDGKINIPKSNSVEDILENLTLSGRKRYVGRNISFNLKDVAVNDILKMIAETSGFNIITTSDVQELPPLSLNLTKIPWDQALDTVLSLNRLVAEKNGMILTIKTMEQATKEAEEAARARQLAEVEEPLVTTVFPISYASNTELSAIIAKYLTPERGSISIDQRTNSLIVNDTSSRIDRIRRIVETLDTQTPQVLIESKIVEVTESFSQEIGLQNGLNFGYDPVGTAGNAQPSPVGAIDRATDFSDTGPGFSFSSAPSSGEGARTLFGLSVSKFNRLVNLDFDLQLLETESKAKIVASPKVITENKKMATLTTTDTTSFSRSTGVGEDRTEEFEEISAELSLQVTPQVTNEGSISLQIQLQKEQFGTRPSAQAPPDKQGRGINTNVLVDNGSTIVLGGIYNFEERESVSGIPFLKDVPLIGWLFRTPYNPTTSKNELVIFITPRVINQEEAGLVDRG